MGLGDLEFCWAGLPMARASDSERMAAVRSCSAAVRVRRSERFLEDMSHRHVRLRVDGGQEAAGKIVAWARATILMQSKL